MGFKGRKKSSLNKTRISIGPDLELRHLTMNDAEALFALVDKNRSYLRQWMPWLDVTTSIEEIRPFLQNTLNGYKAGSSCRWALLVNSKLSGVIGLEAIQPMPKCAKIGYWQSQEYQGRGCVTRAVSALLRYGFVDRELNLLEIRAAKDNHKSRSVASRVGMTFEGILRQREWLYDHHVDHAVYTLLASEWRLLPPKASY